MESFTWNISQQDLIRGPDVGGRMLVTEFLCRWHFRMIKKICGVCWWQECPKGVPP